MKYKIGDIVKIKENYIRCNFSTAFNDPAEKRIKKIDRVATIIECSQTCPYDKHESGYRFKEIHNLVFRESMIEGFVYQYNQSECIESRFEILDL